MTAGDQRQGRRWLLAWRVCRRLPEPLAFLVGRVGGRLFHRLDRRRREALRANLARVLGPGVPPRALERVVRRGFVSYGRYWMEAFRLEDLDAAVLRGRLEVVEGRQHLDAAVAAGRGVILAVPHVGNWDAGGAWVAASAELLGATGHGRRRPALREDRPAPPDPPAGPLQLIHQGTRAGFPGPLRVTAVAERLEPPELFYRFVAYRRALGLEILPLEEGSATTRALLRVLRDGGIVCLVCDRDLTGGGLEVDLFGAPARMPAGPAALALRTGAALLPAAVYHARRPMHWEGVVRPPLSPATSGDQRADVQALTELLAGELQGLIARAPEQWHVLSDHWRPRRPPDPDGVPAPQEPEGSGEPGTVPR